MLTAMLLILTLITDIPIPVKDMIVTIGIMEGEMIVMVTIILLLLMHQSLTIITITMMTEDIVMRLPAI